jgi:hypothetical protein
MWLNPIPSKSEYPHWYSWSLSRRIEGYNFEMGQDRGTRVNVVGWGIMLQAGRSPIRFAMRSFDFLIDLILPAALWPWGRFSLQQKWVPGLFPGVKGGRGVRLTTSPLSVSRLSRNVGISKSQNPMGLQGLLKGYVYLLWAKIHSAIYSFKLILQIIPHNPRYWQANLTEQPLCIRIVQYKNDSVVMAFHIRLK